MQLRSHAAGAPLVIQGGVVVLFLVLWEFAVRLGWIDALFLAGPIQTVRALVPTAALAAPDLAATTTSFAAAFAAGVAAAIMVGLAINLSPYWSAVLVPVFAVGVTVPKVTLLPLFILWFGIGKGTIVIYGALSAFFPMVVNVAAAGREIRPNQIQLARAMGYGRADIFRKVVFPAMLPVMTSGLFYACNAALMGIFIVEMALARNGMGALVHQLAVTFKTGDLYAAVTLTALITVVINMGFWYLARSFGRWRS